MFVIVCQPNKDTSKFVLPSKACVFIDPDSVSKPVALLSLICFLYNFLNKSTTDAYVVF